MDYPTAFRTLEALMEFDDAPRVVRFGRWLFRHRSLKCIFLLPVLTFYGELENCAYCWPVGLVLLILGGGLRLWSISFIGRSARTRKDKAKKLITSGPFALCRNPIYLGNVVATCGFVVLAQVLWYVPLFLVLSFAFYAPVVRYEEYLLKNKYPGVFDKYASQTPRWFPRLNPSALAKPVHGLKEIAYREKSFFRTVTAGLLVVLAEEGISYLYF